MAKTTKPRSAAGKMSDAAKKAMANKGTFKVGGNTDYGKPYTKAVSMAVEPFSQMLKRAQQTWGQRLLECVPPAYAARYASLVADLDEAMIAEDAKATADIADKLCKAIPILHKAALDAGHNPASSDVVTTVLDGVVYAFVVRGDIGLVRRQNPTWVVYALSDAALAFRGRVEDMMQEAAKHFPNVKVSEGSRDIVDDAIEF